MRYHELFEAQVGAHARSAAVVFEERALTYRELNRRANQLAHHADALGVGPKSLVGICVERSLEMVVGLLGILKAGGAYVPLDPEYPKERLASCWRTKVAGAHDPAAILRELARFSATILCSMRQRLKLSIASRSRIPRRPQTPDNSPM